jgi:hypothetical protein
MANQHGDFVWYELMTPDADAAQAFYSGLFGWTWADGEMAGIDYRTCSAGEHQVGGILALTQEMMGGGARPAWLGYVRVDDVPAATERIKAAGGAVMLEGQEVPGVGPFAMVADCCGAPFYVIDDRSGQPSNAFAATEPMVGHCAWNELASANPAAAKTFYGTLFGWEPDGDMDMGELGKYEFWKVGDDRGFMQGAVMPLMPGMPASAWTFYFRVPDIDAAVAYAATQGATPLQEPTEIPGGEFSFTGLDPQGAVFGLVGPRKGA